MTYEEREENNLRAEREDLFNGIFFALLTGWLWYRGWEPVAVGLISLFVLVIARRQTNHD